MGGQDAEPRKTANPTVVEGYVLDPSDARVAKFKVVLRNQQKTYVTESDDEGHYEFRDPEPGRYKLEAGDRRRQCLIPQRRIVVNVERGIKVHKDLEVKVAPECSN